MKPVLLIRGGSIACGAGVSRAYGDILRPRYEALGFEVVNRSRKGDNSFDGIRTFDEDIAPFTPRVLLIHFGIDDAFFPVYRSEFKENLVRMVRRARELFDPALVLPTSHTFDDPYEMDAVHIYYRTIREVCLDLGCEMIAVHTWWAGYLHEHGLENTGLVQRDARLLNARGHEVFAQALVPVLDRVTAVI